jgi:RsiW-degrading membrane proteinase PrsW (M82 family)
MLELLTILAIAVPWALTLYFAESKHHKDINIKFCVFVGTGIVVFLLLSYFFS